MKESEGTRVMRVESQGKFLLPTKLSVNLKANHPHATHEEGGNRSMINARPTHACRLDSNNRLQVTDCSPLNNSLFRQPLLLSSTIPHTYFCCRCCVLSLPKRGSAFNSLVITKIEVRATKRWIMGSYEGLIIDHAEN